ncbi:MAG: hypothetical protein WC310_04390 [Patescibacteria group bacterium]|jgi:hypothetical protein
MSTLYSIGQMNQVADALEAAGYTPDDVTKLRSNADALKQFKFVLGGKSEIVKVKHIVDLDIDPFVPDYWEVVEHIKGGQFTFDPTKVVLYLDEVQKEAGVIVGNQLREKIKDRSAYNANLLDFYLKNPHLIPKEWKGKTVFFWGTIYRDSDGDLCVRFLKWRGYKWHWSFAWVGGCIYDSNPAAVPAK